MKGIRKSGGSRLIIHARLTGKTFYLLSIYDKSEQENLAKGELNDLLNELELP